MSSVTSAATSPTAATSPAASIAPAAAAASSTVTSTGIGSGLNISGIVSALTSAFGAGQQNQLTNQANALDAQVSAFGSFTSSLDTLQSTLGALETPSALAGFKASVVDPTVASATASSGAVAGSYAIAVQNLATATSLTSAPVSSASSGIGIGTLHIAVGGTSTSINIDSSNNTLSGIAAAINGASNNPGVSASIITASDGARLVLTGTTTGAGNTITVIPSGGDGGLSALAYDPSNTAVTSKLTLTQQAANANFTINGFAATSSSNVDTSAITGVTLNLLGASAAHTSTALTITPDTTSAQTSINAFVTALNGTLSTIQTLTGYDASTQTAGVLQGNATLQSFQNQLSNILDTVTSGHGGAQSLSDLGLTANAKTGSYDTNAGALSTVLSSSLTAVGNLLGGKNGIATKLNALVTQYTQVGGLLSNINQGLETGLANEATQQAALNAELATYSATLTKQYNAMDAAVAALKETQTYLNAEFNPGSSSNNSSSNSSLSSGTTGTHA